MNEIKKFNNDTCVVILTGQGDMALAIEALRAGADDFLLKPCDLDELILKMERFFERQDAFRKIKIYEKFLPICMYCKKIRDDSGTDPGRANGCAWKNSCAGKAGPISPTAVAPIASTSG